MKIESAYIELTNLCNLNCKTCYNRSGLNKIKKQLPLETVLQTIELCRSYGTNSFQLSGGETMLYDHIAELFVEVQKMPDVPFTISTNGTVNQELLVATYQNIPNLYVQISLDGSCEEINARTRGKGNFEKSLALIRELHSCDRQIGYRLKMVVSKYNLEDIPAYFELALKYDCEPRFSFMNSLGNGIDHWNEMSLSTAEKMSAFRMITECNQKYSMHIELPSAAFSCPLADDYDKIKLGCMVKVNGDIMPCQALYDERYKLSNIYSFNENEVMRNLKKLQNIVETRMNTSYGCEKCLLNPLCSRGCPAAAVTNCGNILATDYDCELRLKHYLKYQLR